jgi:outer membrane protein OmpA-like peptidoglycan-associated protein
VRRLLLIMMGPVLVVALGACGGGGGGGGGEARRPASATTASPAASSPSGSAEEGLISPDSPLGKAPALATLEGGGRRVEVLALERNTPNTVLARYRERAITPEPIDPGLSDNAHGPDWFYTHYNNSFSAMNLLDLQGRRISIPMIRQDDKYCLCSTRDEWWIGVKLRQGGPPAVAYAVYQLPPEVTQVAIASRKFMGVTPLLPITQPRPDGPKVEDEPDAQTVAQSKGLVESLVSHVESATQRVTDQGDQVRIALNTDVLFAFDKADLTPAAQAELRRVADRVGAQATGTVQVTGHTDDVGSDSYNLDLSRRRAQSVHTALAALLRGKALAFQVAGKGETEPAVKATTPRARARNRRVEVSFERVTQPAPAPPPAAAPPPSAAPASQRPLGSTQGAGEYAGSVVDLLSLRRISADFAVAEVLVSNKGSGQTNLDFYAKGELVSKIGIEPLEVGYSSGEFYWMVLRDASRTSYLVVNDSGKVCVCSQVGGLSKPLKPTESQRLWALLPSPPPSVRTVDVLFAGFPQPIRNVPIG